MTKWKPIDDTIRLDYMTRERVALVPEMEGGWSAEVYGEDGDLTKAVLGADPRDAIDAFITDWREEHDKQFPATPQESQ